MKVLVFGKNGQVGQSLVAELENRGVSYHCVGHEDVDIADVEEIKKVVATINPTEIINATAFHVVAECEKDPEKAFLVNATAVMSLALLCLEKNIQFVTYSSDYVFDGKKAEPYEESDSPNPLQVYGVSKVAGEYLARNYNPKTILIRTSGVYGGPTGSKAKGGNFVINLLRDAQKKDSIEVSSEQVVSTTYAADLSKATLDLLNKKPKGGIYHLANEGYCSWADFAKKIIAEAGLSTKIIPVDRGGYSSNAHRPVFSVLKNTKAAALGVVLPEWKESLKNYIQYLQHQ